MPARYIIRFDDASEYMNYRKWDPFFELIEQYGVKPIVAVIPFNNDPIFLKRSRDDKFWDTVRMWQVKGYHIGIHGFEYLYRNHNRGILGINKYSEFAGVPLERQKEMISKAYTKFKDEGIHAEIFVAPAHSFDKNTLRAIREVPGIKYISDGYFINPIIRNGLYWIPQQLWSPVEKRKGVWTICYHPETSNDSSLKILKEFLESNRSSIADPLSLEFRSMGIADYVFSVLMKIYYKFRSGNYLKKYLKLLNETFDFKSIIILSLLSLQSL